MKEFTLLIKPASADCNLRCDYCFYIDKSSLYPETAAHRMSDEVLERLISSYLETEQHQYVFNWQGGEPTLMGYDFFRKVIDLELKYAKRGSSIGNGLQTNGTLLTDNLANLMSRYMFLAGVSLDGPTKLHNKYRVNTAGKGSHGSVLKGIECLRRNNVEYNILTLVSTANVGHGRRVFNYLTGMGVCYHQYIPCVEFDADGNPLPWCITGEQWGSFLCDVFDEWKSGEPGAVSVRLFDAVLTYLVSGGKTLCHLDDNCCKYFVVEYNGDVYPCDFFVSNEWKLGNILVEDWNSLLDSNKYRRFGQLKSQLPDDCASCDVLHLCQGDCLKHRFRGRGTNMDKSFLCDGWKIFYEHALPDLREMASAIAASQYLR